MINPEWEKTPLEILAPSLESINIGPPPQDIVDDLIIFGLDPIYRDSHFIPIIYKRPAKN
jgi:hypothetical protein